MKTISISEQINQLIGLFNGNNEYFYTDFVCCSF